MKIIFFLSSFFLLVSSDMFAQSQDINRRVGFGGPSFVNTTLAGAWTMEVGGLGGGFVTNQLYFGGGGFGLSQKEDNYEYQMGYGGIMLGYFWNRAERTGLNFYMIAGLGSIEEKGESLNTNSDGFWTMRPAVEVDFLLADWLRLGVGGGYRWVTGSELSTLDDGDMSAPFGSITLRFGNWGK